VELKTEWGKCVFPDLSPYDANIDIFERGSTQERIDPIFATLKKELIGLIQTIQDSGTSPDKQFLQGNFPTSKQEELGRKISNQMGFSFDHGRLDVSIHPFCGGAHPTDVRITTRYREDNFIESLYAVIHETGHGLYEQGRMQEGWDLPVSEPLTMGIHESQSLFWERMIAQSRSFCSHYLATFQSVFNGQFDGVSGDQLYDAVNNCEPSLIRVEADEITYPLHIILRYELEKGLFDGSIQVNDLPGIWNDRMEEYLGIRPPSDSLGVLQDVHWSSGSFGYFPSYTLGAIYACQFFNDWLNKNIHRLGRLYSAEDLVKKVTGEPLNPHLYMSYLKEKYGAIYKIGCL
jgi:carboxypeptidase Taq